MRYLFLVFVLLLSCSTDNTVTGPSDPEDTSSNIEIMEPDGDILFYFQRDTVYICYDKSTVGDVNIYLQTENNNSIFIAERDSVYTYYFWVIPDTLTPADSCLIKVADKNNLSDYDVTDDYFMVLKYGSDP